MSKREINTHRVNGLNEAITLHALDERGDGNANHKYLLEVRSNGPEGKPDGPLYTQVRLDFQNGPVGERGANGISNEALLAVVEDRLAGFQSGPYACAENEAALDSIRAAKGALNARTQRRVAAGTEGTSALDAAAEPALTAQEAAPAEATN